MTGSPTVQLLVEQADALEAEGRFAEAVDLLARARALDPGNARVRLNLSILSLILGRFEAGWRDWGARWESRMKDRKLRLKAPDWDGRPVDGTLLAWGEQGIGDQVLGLGMVDELRARARHVVVAIERRLVPIARRSFPALEVIDIDDVTRTRYDAAVPLGDLGGWLRPGLDAFPRERASYLVADEERAALFRSAFRPRGRLTCGVSWRSRARTEGEAKSMPLTTLAGLLRMPGIVPVNLQYGDTPEEHAALQAACGVTLLKARGVDRFSDLDGLCAVVAACDVVVTTSSVVAHLAGALGRPTCLTLPLARNRMWYWHSGTGRNPWYPTMRMFTQARPGDWSAPVAAVRALVARRLAAAPAALSRPVRPSP